MEASLFKEKEKEKASLLKE